jgi:isopentenyldiphosphate isomerase
MSDELLDIVNDQDVVTGQQMRSTVHQLGLQHRGVHVFLFTRDKKMLVQKRSADRVASPSALDCSVSEHVKAGEDYLSAAMRGMREEMGLEGIEIQPLVTFRMIYGPNDHEISRIYKGMVDPRSVRFDPVEIEKIGYHSLSELRALMRRGDVVFSYWFEQLIKWSQGESSAMNILTTHSLRKHVSL